MKFLIDVCASSKLLQETLTNLANDVVSAREGYSMVQLVCSSRVRLLDANTMVAC